jgi:hypothetical protein
MWCDVNLNKMVVGFCIATGEQPGHAEAWWLRHCSTSRKVAGSRPYEVNFNIYLILPAALGPGFHTASNRNRYQKQKK